MNYIFKILIILLMAACVENQSNKKSSTDNEKQTRKRKNKLSLDLEAILERDTLIAVVNNSSTSYFIYKG